MNVRPALVVSVVAGPDAGWSRALEAGTHWVGRAGGLRLADTALESHHARLVVTSDGDASLLHVAGRGITRVDGEAAATWVPVTTGSVIEVGHSRLLVGPPSSHAATPVPHVYAPLDPSDRELARFERDVGRAARAAEAERTMARRPAGTTQVVLGEGPQRLPVRLRDADDRPTSAPHLDHVAQLAFDRQTTRTLPVVATLGAATSLALVAPDPDRVVRSMRDPLPPRDRARLIVVAQADADPYEDVERPLVVVADDVESLPSWCTALLEVGATWWGDWQPELLTHPERRCRLHVRGSAEPQPTPVGRSSLRR